MGGSSDTDTPPKALKASEQPPNTAPNAAAPVYPDWSSFQAYSPIAHPGYFQSPVASGPQPHAYMWGSQHIVPPYGTPPHYVMYPPGAVYAHPSMPAGTHPFIPYTTPTNGNVDNAGAVPSGSEKEGKANNDVGKTSGASANGVSHSGESGSESSSDGSDANSQNSSAGQEEDNPRNSSHGSQNGMMHGMLNSTVAMVPVPASLAASGPATNLNIGMDHWGVQAASTFPVMHGKVSPNAIVGGVASAEQCIQDERELKRQKRKQSNRESARRSRLRKQAECEELGQRAESLRAENTSLKIELERIRKEYDELVSQNISLKKKLGENGTSVDENCKNHQNSDILPDKANPC